MFLEQSRANTPAISIARVRTKYELESPFIGAAVSRGVICALRESGRLAKGLGRVLIIGFGAVGKATTQALSKLRLHESMQVYDIKWKVLKKEIEKAGAQALKDFPRKGAYDSVFGCTGYASFPTERLNVLNNEAVLVSGSSAAIEFNREKFIDLAYQLDKDDFFIVDPEKIRNIGIHATINMQKGNKKFSFINAGFPVNFDGSIECLPHLIIQITHGMLLAAAYETMHYKQPGLHCLNRYHDDWFYKHGLYWIERYSKS